MGIVRMRLEATLIGERQHLVVDTGRITDTQDVDASVNEFLRDPVDSHITLCTYQHLTLTHQCLTDGFYERCRLTSARRAMDDSDILCPQHPIDGILLRSVQIREVHRLEDKSLRRTMGIEEVAQLTQASFSLDGTIKGFYHQAIARLVERELYA